MSRQHGDGRSRRGFVNPALRFGRAPEPIESDGGSRGMIDVGRLARTWHTIRMGTSTSVVIAGSSLGVLWGWPGGYVAAVLGGVALVDAIIQRRAPGDPTRSLLLDITLIGVAMITVTLEPEGIVAPLLYMLTVPLLMLPWRRAVKVMLYGVVWSAIAVTGVELVAPVTGVIDSVVSTVTFVIFGGHIVALIGVMAYELDRSNRAYEVKLGYQHALTNCGRALLSSTDESAIDYALRALLDAVPGQKIFVDENVHDPEKGLSARVVKEAIRRGYDNSARREIWPDPDDPSVIHHRQVPYTELPSTYASLSVGEPAVVITAQLEGREREIYAEDGCKSELNIPIFTAGKWAGSIGFAEYLVERSWSDDDVQILQTAAAMIGAFWERQKGYDRLQQLIRSKDEFLASVSHEIRTPLTAVLGFASLLDTSETTSLPPTAAELIGMISDQAQEVAFIVEDLLVAARADIQQLTVVPEVIDVKAQLETVLTAKSDPRPEVAHDGEGASLAWADASRVRQIIRCLLSNAARYGGEHTEIGVRTQDDRVLLAISDNGEGVPASEQEHIFEAFHRAHDRHGQPQAMGLGLYVARNLARLMGGDLIHRRSNDLTTFELSLPVAASGSQPFSDDHSTVGAAPALPG